MELGEHRDAAPGETVRVTLEIARAGDTIRGELAVGDRPPSAFFGWLELIARLERETAGPGQTGVANDQPERAGT
jgi:hypothetical protein